ncbi:pilus assembly protein TadG-related protein [Aeromicrobium sp.]|uniref:pilus assembly protein TadG-related protein n=1 Tax=Aeromicrobium sp. TaxID=1871063 RepID=UPI0019B91B62|nr:pilus assembly protein TadG-related protein [Aeromicrobium sp.]MBC7631169.1 hypothetical protein [Aeromicrobium sp.]
MRRDDGQITVMTIGFLLLVGLLTVVVINSSAAFLQRQQLNNVADGAALAAADGLSRSDFYRTGRVVLDDREARRLVSMYVSDSGAQATSVTIDGDRVHVRLEWSVSLALTPPGWASRTTIVSEATSQLLLSD